MNEYTLIGMLYTALQTALLACIRYRLYQNSLRIPAKTMYLLSFCISISTTLIWIAIGGVVGMAFSMFRILLAVAMFAVSCCVIREPFAKHTYTYSFIMVYDTAVEISASFAQSRLMPGPRGVVFALTAALLLGASFIPALRNLKRMIDRLSVRGGDKLWGWLSVISFSYVFMNLLFTFPLSQYPTVRELISRYLMLLGIIGLFVATTRAVETMHEAAETKAELNLVYKQVDTQKSYYARLVSQTEEVRRMRHDLRHHRAALDALVKSGDMAALMRYADAVTVSEEPVPVTGNLAADSILLYYLDAAEKLGTKVETDIAVDAELPLADPDLCVILGNLLENAVDAQRRLPPAERFLCVKARGDKSGFTLAVDNHFDGVLRGESGAYQSSKEGEGHGLGLASVKAVCEKYGGVLHIETGEHLFMAGVVIGL